MPSFNPDLPHAGRIVLVTGASRGIGYAAAKAFGAAGAHVVALARTVGGLEALDDTIKSAGGKTTLVPADLSNPEALTKLSAILAERFGRLDAFIANAGVLGDLTPVTAIEGKVWNRAMQVNVTANLHLLQGLDPLLRASSAGRVVGITSGRARKFVPFGSIYGATKAAFEHLILTYAAETADTAIRANLVDPGPMRTAMRAKAMPGEDPETLPHPDELAPLILSLASPAFEKTGEVEAFQR